MTEPRWGRAVVIGGSIAGSLAARVLRDHFAEVIVLDKDDLPDGPVPRLGAMQGVHFHALLARGRMVAEELFPGFVEDLMAQGASYRPYTEAMVYEPYGWAPRRTTPGGNAGASRLLIESVIRRRARELSGVEVHTGVTVTGLASSEDRRRITGVVVEDPTGSRREYRADLVVDASGRTSKLLTWLEALGYGAPVVTSVNAFWGYSSRFFAVPDGIAPSSVGGFPLGAAASGPAATRGGYLLKLENGTWQITLSGCARDFPPGDEDGLLAFADSLPYPHIADTIRQSKPLSDIYLWRNTTNRRRYLDQLPAWPEGFIALADAVCAFNPVYGQGMTVASLEALGLRAELAAQPDADDLAGLGRRFQARLARILDQPWETACRSDYGVPGVEGAPPPPGFDERFATYQRLLALGRDDTEIYEKILMTNQLLITAEWQAEPALRERILADWDELGRVMGRVDPRPAR